MTWIVGFVFSLAVGHAFVAPLRWWLYKRIGIPMATEKGVPAWFLGVAERAFFTAAIAFELSGAAVAMMAWVALKMASYWTRGADDEIRSRGATAAALLGLTSMGFALVGGLICIGKIPIDWLSLAPAAPGAAGTP